MSRFLSCLIAVVVLLVVPPVFAGESNERFPMHYHPQGNGMWDTWYVQDSGITHVYYLQSEIAGQSRTVSGRAIGHATSTDLIHWEEQSGVILPGDPSTPETAYDSGQLFTGCAVRDNGIFYNFYCGNHAGQFGENTPVMRQSICLATSEDGFEFTKFEGNPVIEPIPGKYFNWFEEVAPFPHHAHEWVDCRDLTVVKNPNRNEWLGYCVMRTKNAKNAFESSCIVLCRSRDLYHWTVEDPICKPNRFNCFEVPDVFCLNGRWFMIALTGDMYGQSERWTDKEITGGTLVFESDSPELPFTEVRDNLLLADKHKNQQGYSARTVLRNNERLMLYTRKCPDALGSRLSWPVVLQPVSPDAGSGLFAHYWSGCDAVFKTTIMESEYVAVHTDPLTVLGETTTDRTWMLHGNLERRECFTVCLNDQTGPDSCYHAEFDPQAGAVRLLDNDKTEIMSRTLEGLQNGFSSFRIVMDDGLISLFLDDILAVNYCLADWTPGRVTIASGNGIVLSSLKSMTGQDTGTEGVDP